MAAAIEHILKEVIKLCTPTRAEEEKVRAVVKEILDKVNSRLKKDKTDAKLIVGGSVAKGTWLPGISDSDFFLMFNYEKFSEKSYELSSLAEKTLKKCFRQIERLHGSRDYFSADYKGFYLEFVPVLEIKNVKEEKNITDASPLHVDWIKDKIKGNNNLAADIRLSKQFCKAQGIYGAESYISGFSGHVIEILVIYYGSFLKFLANACKWKEKDVIDVECHYKNKSEALKAINASKLQSPIIVVDPVEPDRNAVAALSKEKFLYFKSACNKFLRNPSLDSFKEKRFDIKDLIKNKKDRKLIVLEAKPERKKIDIAGAKLLKKFQTMQEKLKENEFTILKSGWWWDEKKPAVFWFYFDKKELPKTKLHIGPPVKIKKEYIAAFKKAWKGKKVKKSKTNYYVELPRKYRKPEQLIKDFAKQDKNLKILKIA